MNSPRQALLSALFVTVVATAPCPVAAQSAVQGGRPPAPVPAAGIGYADAADLILASPVIADVTIRSQARIKGAEAANVPPGMARFYLEADVVALVRGPGAVPPKVGYLVDIATDASGRLPKLRKARMLVFARPVPGTMDQLQLVRPDAQLRWTPGDDALVRRITAEIVARDAPPVVTGIGNAFHVPGSLPGEGETQIFLTTADNRPVSLSVLRRPGEQPRWAVALSEIVDDAAAPPRRDTLLWYRLACALPPALPERSTASMEAADADVARADYRLVLDRLGPCGRTGPAPRQ